MKVIVRILIGKKINTGEIVFAKVLGGEDDFDRCTCVDYKSEWYLPYKQEEVKCFVIAFKDNCSDLAQKILLDQDFYLSDISYAPSFGNLKVESILTEIII